MKNWLDKYEYGGQAGYTDVPFNYNSAWGGQFQNGGISFLSLPQEDPEMVYTDRFNTPLNKKETEQFNKWVAKESERQGRDIMMDKGAYDIQGFWKSGDYKKMDEDNHGTDTWKKPNHPTFSNQSIYHGVDGFYGGNWTPEDGYQPSKQTADMYGPSYYSWLFGREPERPEHLDASRFRSGANAPSPLYYAMGGSLPGTVGFTYARTKGIPSNGPYAKKTKASAQNGNVTSSDDEIDYKELQAKNLEESVNFLKDWYTNRATLPQFKDVSERRLKVLEQPIKTRYVDPQIMSARGFAGAYNPTNKFLSIVDTDPSLGDFPEYSKFIEYSTGSPVVTHELFHKLHYEAPQFTDVVPEKITEKIPGYPELTSPEYVNLRTGKLKMGPKNASAFYPEMEAITGMLRQAETIDPIKPVTADDVSSYIKKYDKYSRDTKMKDLEVDKVQEFHRGRLIKQLFDVMGNDPERIAAYLNSVAKNESQQKMDVAQDGNVIPDDRSTKEFWKKLEDYYTGDKISDEEKAKYKTFKEYNEKHGYAPVRITDRTIMGKRQMTNPFTGEINIIAPDENDPQYASILMNEYLDEYPHYQQFNKNPDESKVRKSLRFLGHLGKDFGTMLTNLPSSGFSFQKAYDEAYKTPGTLEYEAHKVLEPEMDKELKSMLEQNLNPKQRNGGMTYYQHGLDWKPKTISRDGSDIPKNQNAKYILPNARDLARQMVNKTDAPISIQEKQRKEAEAEEFNRRNRATAKRQFVSPARAQTIDEQKINEQKKKSYVDTHPYATLDDQGNIIPKYPDRTIEGEALPYTTAAGIDKGMEHFANALEAAGYVEGLGALGSAARNAIAESMESGLLSNAYKLNPWAEKLANPNRSYRVAGMDAARDFEATGVLRSNPTIVPANLSEGILGTRTTPFPSFQKGYADLRYLPEEGGVIFETDLPTFKRGEINPVTGNKIRGSHYAHRAIDPTTGKVLTEIPSENVRMFGSKPNWLRGYKEVPKPTSVSSSVESVKPNFKSEIDWGKWNPETPNYPELINEYNAIEESTKKAGTWMKNPDGSTFQGTPEQFIQQQSSYFKKAFGDSKLVNPDGSPAFQYHGGKKGYEQFLTPQDKGYIKRDSYTGDQGIYFTPSKSRGKSYARNTPKDDRELYQTYINMENPYTGKIKGTFGKDQITNEQYEELLKNKYDGIIDKNLFPYHRQTIVFDPKRIKSAVGNVGFFDMTNPNIYKGLVPAGIVGAAALEQKKKGGIIKDDMGQWAHPGEITEIGSNQITMQGVPYPVLGISDTGDTQMMYPEQEYKFKGKKVTEYPMAQTGYVQPPTRSDSLFLLNNNKIIEDLLKTGKYKWSRKIKTDSEDWKNQFKAAKEFWDTGIEKELLLKNPGIKSKGKLSDYKKQKGKFIGTSDWLSGGGDDYGYPIQYITSNIVPQFQGDLVSTSGYKENPFIYSYGYEPLAITPWDMLNEKQQQQRLKIYGTSGTPYTEQPQTPKREEPKLKRKVSKMEPISTKSSYTPSLRTIQHPNIELPGIQMGDYDVSYYSPESKDWANRRFTSQEESDRFAQEMSQRGYSGSYGNVTQTKKTNKKSTGGWLDKYN